MQARHRFFWHPTTTLRYSKHDGLRKSCHNCRAGCIFWPCVLHRSVTLLQILFKLVQSKSEDTFYSGAYIASIEAELPPLFADQAITTFSQRN